jgi:hypothetical protein
VVLIPIYGVPVPLCEADCLMPALLLHDPNASDRCSRRPVTGLRLARIAVSRAHWRGAWVLVGTLVALLGFLPHRPDAGALWSWGVTSVLAQSA